MGPEEIRATQALAALDTGISKDFLVAMLKYERATDTGTRILGLQSMVAMSKDLALAASLLNPVRPGVKVPASIVRSLQDMRAVLEFLRVFGTKKEYLDILAQTNWQAPPVDSVPKYVDAKIATMIALSAAYQRAPNTEQRLEYGAALDREAMMLPKNTSVDAFANDPRAVAAVIGPFRGYVAGFARAYSGGKKTKHDYAMDAMHSFGDWTEAYSNLTNDEQRKIYDDAELINRGKSPPRAHPMSHQIARELTAASLRVGPQAAAKKRTKIPGALNNDSADPGLDEARGIGIRTAKESAILLQKVDTLPSMRQHGEGNVSQISDAAVKSIRVMKTTIDWEKANLTGAGATK